MSFIQDFIEFCRERAREKEYRKRICNSETKGSSFKLIGVNLPIPVLAESYRNINFEVERTIRVESKYVPGLFSEKKFLSKVCPSCFRMLPEIKHGHCIQCKCGMYLAQRGASLYIWGNLENKNLQNQNKS